MSDTPTAVLAVVIAGAHTGLFGVSWAWAARTRYPWFLILLVPAAVAWAVAGFPLVRALTYGTRPFGAPRGGLQTAGFVALIGGFVALATCVLGIVITLSIRAAGSRRGYRVDR